MSTPVGNDGSNGLVTSRDPSSLVPGEMSVVTGGEYHLGSPHLYKMPGRTTTGVALGAAVTAVTKLQYDSGTDILVADVGANIKEATASLTPSFSTTPVTTLLLTGIPQYTGIKNEWIRCDGINQNYLRENGAVPNGTEGNWRALGMKQAGPVSRSSIKYVVGGTLKQGTSFTNSVYDQGLGTDGYIDPLNAGDASGVDTFSTGYTWHLSGTHTGIPGQDGSPFPNGQFVISCIFNFSSNLVSTGRSLIVKHAGRNPWAPEYSNLGSQPFAPVHDREWKLEYSLDSTNDWQPMESRRYTDFPEIATAIIPLSDNYNMYESATSYLKVRATMTLLDQVFPADMSGTTQAFWRRSYAPLRDMNHLIHDIEVTSGVTTPYSATDPIFYGLSEVYTDSDGVEHQSNMGTNDISGTNNTNDVTLKVSVADLQLATSITLALPGKANPLTTQYKIWRSLDTPGGGFPAMFNIATIPSTSVSYTDYFKPLPSDTAANSLLEEYQVLEILYPTGETTQTSLYDAPPLSFMSLVFQGCVCYFPAPIDLAQARRLYYSLPASTATNSLEQVPLPYYLDFQTPKNDIITSGAVTNGGRSLLVFFESYTMLVNFLPQGADPGGFSNSVKEYVSNTRGCAGARACTEFTLPSGQTFVAALDALGIWITNGVNVVDEWSNDLAWDTTFTGVDFTTMILVDKPHKRRLELLYLAADGTRKEYHLFYGRMKQSIDGKSLPLITGPHYTGVQHKHYTLISGKWVGFSSDASTIGKVFIEDTQAADDSQGYDSTGIVPWQVTLGDAYVGGIHKAQIVETASLKFADTPVKDIQIIGTFTRDSGTSSTISKVIKGTEGVFPKTIYWHQYCDRHKIGFTDLTNTAAPEFIGYVIETRSAGGSRDK